MCFTHFKLIESTPNSIQSSHLELLFFITNQYSIKDKYYFGRYLGLAVYISPALTEEILKMNGEVVHQSTYRSLTAQELKYEEDLWRNFYNYIEEKIGPKLTVIYFDDMNMEETPTFEM